MIFKKRSVCQGNHIFTNGVKAIFNEDGLYKTNKASEIAELSAEPELFEEVKEEEAPAEIKDAPKVHEQLAKVITGLQTTKTSA